MSLVPTPNVLLPLSPSSAVLSIFDAHANTLASAGKAVLSEVASPFAQFYDTLNPDTGRSITLTLTKTATPTQAVPVRPYNLASAGLPPTTKTNSATTSTIATVTFDISPHSGNGFAQSISDHAEAHQTVHQTASGFYVDTYGMKPGELSVVAIVAFNRDVASQIQVFKDLLFKAKLITGAIVTAPPRLMYVNSIDGRQLLLTQTSLDVEQSVDDPNLAKVTIKATILTDYSGTQQPKQVSLETFASSANADLQIVTDSATGATTNNTSTVAGEQAYT